MGMKRILCVMAVVSALGGGVARAADAIVYSEAIDDLPLMQDMDELSEQAIIFDTPDGRIIETTAETGSSEKQVITYYDKNLPPLGWRPLGRDDFGLQNYLRDGERLSLRAEHGGPVLRIHFSLSPKPEHKK